MLGSGAFMSNRIILVSNRLPFVLKKDEEEEWLVEASSGGLITALVPVLQKQGGVWIGWSGAVGNDEHIDTALRNAEAEFGYELKAVELDKKEVHNFYNGFSNEIIWPLFHDLQTICNFYPEYWETYCEVNRKFSAAIRDVERAGDFIWVHDYHLMNVALELRVLGSSAKTAFFLHIPFPSIDLFSKLPWSKQLLSALLAFELIGFQTVHDRDNFLQCARELMPELEFREDGKVIEIMTEGRVVKVGYFPISIDFNAFVANAMKPAVEAKAIELRQMNPDGALVLGIDRLDYTKGIPLRLRAFQTLLSKHPELREKISLIQVVVPSRENIPEYDALKTMIDQLVGQINGEFGKPGGWVPVWYVYGKLTKTELLAYYRAADIALVTPIRDGMNLVAKEFCASSIEVECILILSEFAGAAAQLGEGALLVNPYDTDGVADALLQAYLMSPQEKRSRMKSLRESIQKHDIFRWMRDFMAAAGEEERAIARTGQSEKSAADAGASSHAQEASGVIAS
jgi:alpha,alpha-trehalose-phosphate synthase [UDP-forming]